MMMRNWQKTSMVLLLFFFVLAVPGFAAAEHAQTVLRVGFVREEGYLTIDQKGYYSGYAYEYLQTLSQYGSWRCEYLEGTWEQCLERLRSGEIDVMAGISDTAENEQSMAFSSLPMGRTHMDFVVRGGQRNLRSFVGSAQALRYGKLSYDPSSPGLERMAKQQGIRLQPKLYRSMDQMTEDYVQGRLDGFSSSLQHRAAFPVAAFFDVTPLYLAVRKGNTELLDKLDRAMESMELLDPQRQSRLFEKYYRQGSTRPLSLTEEEREYLQQKGSLIAVGTPGERPHSYFEHGEYRGNLAEIMRRIAADLGITFEYIETQSNEEAIQLLNEGRADIITEFYCDYNWGRQHHLHLTTPFMQLHYAAVTRRGTALPERPRIAVARGHFYVEAFVVRRYPDEELVYFDTMEECLRAVSEGNADLAFMKSDMTQYSIRQGDFMNLMPSGDVWFTHDVSIGVSDQADPVLLRILNKEINHLDPELIQRIMAKSLLDQKETVSLKILAYNHPLEFFGILLFIAVLIITSLIYILQIRRRHTKHIQELAYTDPVTGLHNQYWFEQHVPKLIEEHLADMKAQLVVVVLGMSRMDILLESYGREFVREQLCVLAEELRMQADWVKVVTSVSGHLLLLCRMDSLPDFVELLQQALQEYTAVKRSELNLQLNLKAGVCVLPRRSDKLAQTISCAETAYAELYGVAEVVQVFDDKLQQELDLQQKIEGYMEEALQREEFEVWYQPKYDIRTHRVSGAEALVRWRSAKLGFLMPGQFIELFERNGFVVALDFYVLEAALRWLRSRLDHGLPIVPVSVNQSRLHLSEKNYLQRMQRLVELYGLPAGTIELELTETAFADFEDPEQCRKIQNIMQSLQQMGFSISVDDFGSGYSSVMLLSLLPMDVMKIDRSLLTSSEDSVRMQKILANVIRLGQNLKMKIICEGIETREQEELLLHNGCNYGQGYLFAKPMPCSAFEEFWLQHQ